MTTRMLGPLGLDRRPLDFGAVDIWPLNTDGTTLAPPARAAPVIPTLLINSRRFICMSLLLWFLFAFRVG